MPAYNWRFGAMAAVTPQKGQCGNEHLYPAETFVEAATAPSRWDVVRHPAEAAARNIERKRERELTKKC